MGWFSSRSRQQKAQLSVTRLKHPFCEYLKHCMQQKYGVTLEVSTRRGPDVMSVPPKETDALDSLIFSTRNGMISSNTNIVLIRFYSEIRDKWETFELSPSECLSPRRLHAYYSHNLGSKSLHHRKGEPSESHESGNKPKCASNVGPS